MERVHEGDRFVATRDIATSGMTHWGAPFTSGFETVIPEGTVLVASQDALEGAPGFYLRPEQYEAMETLLVPEEDRLAEAYAGYSFVFDYTDIGEQLERI